MPSRRSLVILVLCALAGAGALSGLGFWQLERLRWKEALLARIADRLSTPPRPLPPASGWRELANEEHEYERFVVEGVFEPREALVWRATGKVPGEMSQPG